jgi:hypothetical protein
MRWFKKIWGKFTGSNFYKMYKEELRIIPILLLVFLIFNKVFILLFPEQAFFDYAGELETIILKITTFFITLWTSNLALRMSFPGPYKFIRDKFYNRFDELPSEKKMEYSVKLILVFILSGALIFA